MKSKYLFYSNFCIITIIVQFSFGPSEGLRIAPPLPIPPTVTLLALSNRPDIDQLNTTNDHINYDVISSFSNGEYTYRIPTARYDLSVLCNSTYPVEWVPDLQSFKYNARALLNMRMGTRRHAKEVLDSSTFAYSSVLLLFRNTNQLTGRYLCRSTRNNSLFVSVYMFWEANNLHQYLVLSQNNITLERKEADSPGPGDTDANVGGNVSTNVKLDSQNDIVLPCTVSTPDVAPVLFKLFNKKQANGTLIRMKELRTNNSIHYDPRVGFTLTRLQNPGGSYKCVTNQSNWEEDYLIINVPSLSTDHPQNLKLSHIKDGPQVIQSNLTGNVTSAKTKKKPVIQNSTPKPVTNMVTPKSKPTFTYNEERQEIVCCSGLGKGTEPRIFHYFCDHPSLCSVLSQSRPLLQSGYYDGVGRTRKLNGCVSYKVVMHINGNIRCIGPDFDVNRNYVVSFEAIFEQRLSLHNRHRFNSDGSVPAINESAILMWNTWNEIKPEEMMLVLVHILGTPVDHYLYTRNGRTSALNHDLDEFSFSGPIYTGQQLSIDCHISNYYFASGIKWALKFKNDSIRFLPDRAKDWLDTAGKALDINVIYTQYRHTDSLLLVADENIASVICLAPIWNSTLWVHKPYYLNVNKSIAPEVINVTDTNPTWFLNDTQKSIKCVATGLPPPTFVWYRENEVIENGTNVEIITGTEHPSLGDFNNLTANTTTTSVLTILRVSFGSHGNYTCEVKNLAGSGSKFVVVKVLERSSWKIQYTIVVGFFVSAVLLIGLGALVWKLRQEQRNIRNMPTGYTSNSEGIGEDIHSHTDTINQTYDPTLLNGGLLR